MRPAFILGISVWLTAALAAGPIAAQAQDAPGRGEEGEATRQMEDGTATQRSTPRETSGRAGVRAIGAAGSVSLALKADGTVWACGDNAGGDLCDRLKHGDSVSIPLRIPGVTEVAAIAAGYRHNLVLKADGTVWGWGDGSYGELGDGKATDSIEPVRASGLTGVTAIAAFGERGGSHSLALKRDGTVWAWGQNYFGELGDGTTTDRHTPVQVSDLTGVTAIACGYRFSLALKSDGSVWAWGWYDCCREWYEGTRANHPTPVQVSGLTGIAAISAVCRNGLALKKDGSVWAWGDNRHGQLGVGTTADRETPVQVSGLTGVTAIAMGSGHCLALKGDGTVWAWGANDDGQLGDGTKTERLTPVQVSGLSKMTAITGANSYSLALKADGTVWAWGWNAWGELGDGTVSDRLTPVQSRF